MKMQENDADFLGFRLISTCLSFLMQIFLPVYHMLSKYTLKNNKLNIFTESNFLWCQKNEYLYFFGSKSGKMTIKRLCAHRFLQTFFPRSP